MICLICSHERTANCRRDKTPPPSPRTRSGVPLLAPAKAAGPRLKAGVTCDEPDAHERIDEYWGEALGWIEGKFGGAPAEIGARNFIYR
jgi:hypothetical protein